MLTPEQVEKLNKENIQILHDLYERVLEEPGRAKEPVHGSVIIAMAIIKSAQMIAFAMAKESIVLKKDRYPDDDSASKAEPNNLFKPYPYRTGF